MVENADQRCIPEADEGRLKVPNDEIPKDCVLYLLKKQLYFRKVKSENGN